MRVCTLTCIKQVIWRYYMEIFILLFCIVGCGVSCWIIGHNSGMHDTIDVLTQNGTIELEE